MGYKKSAKDLAFDRERTRLQAEIGRLRDTVLQKDKTISALTDELRYEREANEKKQERIEQLQGLLDLDCDDIRNGSRDFTAAFSRESNIPRSVRARGCFVRQKRLWVAAAILAKTPEMMNFIPSSRMMVAMA